MNNIVNSGTEIVRVYKNAKGEAFKEFFEYIKINYPDGKFTRKSMPKVSKRYIREVESQTKGTYWISSSPEIAAAETILLDLCNNGLLKIYEKIINEYNDKEISFSLTKKGEKTRVAFG